MGDRTLEREVLQLFQSHSRLQLVRLGAAVGDAKKWRDAAHAIKGSARGVGAWPLAVSAERAELADGGSQAIQAAIVLDVTSALTEANAYIDTLFAA
jgi:HPt (histidine-containing phosphotransfer) domain-containing protein